MTLSGLPQAGLLQSATEVVAGSVAANGTITAGSGFSVNKTGTGTYTITFTRAFSGTPVALVVPVIAFSTGGHAQLVTASSTQITVETATFNETALADKPFAFIAYIAQGAITVPRDFGIVTALPTSPTPQTGDRCYLVDSLSAPTYGFDLVYNASASTYKWYCRGGVPLFAEVPTAETTTATAYTGTQPATAGPTVTPPVSGDYDVTIACMGVASTDDVWYMSYAIGGTAASANDEFASRGTGSIGNVQAQGIRKRRKTGLTAGNALTSKYKTVGGTLTVTLRWIMAMPVRVG